MNVGVVGSRGFHNYALMREELGNLGVEIARVVSGGASGADALAERYSREVLRKEPVVFAPKEEHGAARFARRNQKIVAAADMVVAFWDGSSRGTAMTMRMARRAKKPVRVVNYREGTARTDAPPRTIDHYFRTDG